MNKERIIDGILIMTAMLIIVAFISYKPKYQYPKDRYQITIDTNSNVRVYQGRRFVGIVWGDSALNKLLLNDNK